jgi:hypothetical protein
MKLLDALQLNYSIVVNKFDEVDDDEYDTFKTLKDLHDHI